MRAFDPALALALAISLLLHGLLLASADPPLAQRDPAPAAEQLAVTLSPAALPATAPALRLDEEKPSEISVPRRSQQAPRVTAAAAAPARHSADPVSLLTGEAAAAANRQLAEELLYPPAAIASGMEGQALVLLFLDAGGNAIAARLEASSGYELLDLAAVRAARTLRALPSSAPREALLPVRFRLH